MAAPAGEICLGGFASANLKKGLMKGYGVYITNRRIIGVKKRKLALPSMLLGGVAAWAMEKMTEGERIKLVVYRDGRRKNFDLVLGEKKTAYVTIDMDDDDMPSKACLDRLGRDDEVWVTSGGDRYSVFGDRPMLGVQLHELDGDLAPYFKVGEDEGVLVLKVLEDSPAEKAGIRAGDVIVEVGGRKVEDIDDVFEALSSVEVDSGERGGDGKDEEETVSVKVMRKGRPKTFEVVLDDDFDLHVEKMIVAPGLDKFKRLEMMYEPAVRAMKMQEMEQEKFEARLRKLEKELKKLQKKLEEMVETD